MTTSTSLRPEGPVAVSIPVLKEISSKVDTLRKMLEKVAGPSDVKKRMKDVITEILNLVDISIRDSDDSVAGGVGAADAYRIDGAIQGVIDKTLDRLMHVEKRASAAEAENKLIKQEYERLTAHQKQQDELLENIQRLYREARDCSDRNATSAKEWRARAHELEAELTAKKAISGDQEKIMQRLRALYIRYTELAARMKERDTELRTKDEIHKAEIMNQKSLANERTKTLEQEISALKRQIELLKKLERSPRSQFTNHNNNVSRTPQTPPFSLPKDRSLREDSDQGVGTIFVRKPFVQIESSQQSNKVMECENVGNNTATEDIDPQILQQIQETMDKHHPRVYYRRTTDPPEQQFASQHTRLHSADISTKSKIRTSSYQTKEERSMQKYKSHPKDFKRQYERPKYIQSLLKSTSVYDLVEPSTNTTGIFPSESSVQEHDLKHTKVCEESPDPYEDKPEEEADLQKSNAHAILTGLFQCLKQTEEQIMATDTKHI